MYLIALIFFSLHLVSFTNVTFLVFEKDNVLKLVASPHVQGYQRFRNVEFTMLHLTNPSNKSERSFYCVLDPRDYIILDSKFNYYYKCFLCFQLESYFSLSVWF